jgi:DNA-binding response OmpR family regulator
MTSRAVRLHTRLTTGAAGASVPGAAMPHTGKRVLVVEDDPAMARVVCDNLIIEGFDVRHAGDGDTALRCAAEFHPDLVLLDIMLPDTTGFDVCSALRRRGAAALIIMTACSQKSDKLKGLDLGADDYVTKPFDIDELLARIRAVLRRARAEVEQLVLGVFTVDLNGQRASDGVRAVALTRRECELLRYLAERMDRVVYRDELLRDVWGYTDAPLTRSVDSAIARLRKKIEPEPSQPRFIHTVHGDGYCLTSAARDLIAAPTPDP